MRNCRTGKTFILATLILMLVSVSLLCAAPLKKSVVTTFTASKHCFVGFSNKNVTNCVQLRSDETYTSFDGAHPVKFKFYPDDPIVSVNPSESPGVYISDLFYAYCQSFSRSPLTVTLTASDNLVCKDTPDKPDKNTNIPYELIDQKELINDVTSKAWGTSKSITISEKVLPADEQYTEPRVVMSQPILMKVISKNVQKGEVLYEVENNKRYHVSFTLKVSTTV